jgi:hypothetical protein
MIHKAIKNTSEAIVNLYEKNNKRLQHIDSKVSKTHNHGHSPSLALMETHRNLRTIATTHRQSLTSTGAH